MTKDRMLFLLALALVLGLGIGGYQAVAQDLASEPQLQAIIIGHITGASPDATSPGMFQGITAFGPNPPAAGDWPCFGGSTNCAAVPAGGLVVGTPLQVWSKSCSGCGQIYWTFQTTSATGNANIVVNITQGSPATSIFHFSGTLNSIPKNVIETISLGPVSFTGVAGSASISVNTTIGTATIKGGTKIVLH